MARFYQLDLSQNIDSPFVRDGDIIRPPLLLARRAKRVPAAILHVHRIEGGFS